MGGWRGEGGVDVKREGVGDEGKQRKELSSGDGRLTIVRLGFPGAFEAGHWCCGVVEG